MEGGFGSSTGGDRGYERKRRAGGRGNIKREKRKKDRGEERAAHGREGKGSIGVNSLKSSSQ
ncbi:hypothetical protein LINPERPRIM_LOCUS6285 [Linum perenne]